MTSPTARSLQELRKQGLVCQVVEHWNAFSRMRNDLLGVIDIVAVGVGIVGVLGVQATTTGNMMARIQKGMAEPRLKVWLQSGNHFQVWGWSKKGKRGEKKVWTLTKKQIVLCGDALGYEPIA